MELEEMRQLWDSMSQELEKQKLLTEKMIIDMTQQKYRTTLKGITLPELAGTVICFLGSAFIILNFEKLDTWYLVLSGVISAMFLIILPILSWKALLPMQKMELGTYKESLKNYAERSQRFTQIQKLSYYLGYIVAVAILPVSSKLINGKDIIATSNYWILPIIFLVVFHFFFSKKIFKYYNRVSREARELLEDLNVEKN